MTTPLYDQEAVQPMRDELLAVGFTELLTSEDVENSVLLNNNETILVFINSVCGCAAGSARPGISLALQNPQIPNRLYTVFAGQEREAVDKVRSLIKNFPPSSPSVALFRNGELIYFLPRFEIEGYSAVEVAKKLVKVFNLECNGVGPSITSEQFAQIETAKACGSKIPIFSK